MKNSMAVSQKLKIELSYDPAILSIYPRELKAGILLTLVFSYPCLQWYYSQYSQMVDASQMFIDG